ncbi:MAG: hypothetical protein ABJN42_16015, partial [Roseibium sp.]|uniref:hypothetical protein n=1 Tax=Roseibium sp. TaxID=1936156 RepID=UPI003296B2AC
MVREAGLNGFNLSPDKIRDVVAGDTLSPGGQFIPNHEFGPIVHKIFMDSIDRRIAGGEVICIDATMSDGAELYKLWKTFDQAGYEGLLIDFYGFDDELRHARNHQRAERERVPDASVNKMKAMAARSPVPP